MAARRIIFSPSQRHLHRDSPASAISNCIAFTTHKLIPFSTFGSSTQRSILTDQCNFLIMLAFCKPAVLFFCLLNLFYTAFRIMKLMNEYFHSNLPFCSFSRLNRAAANATGNPFMVFSSLEFDLIFLFICLLAYCETNREQFLSIMISSVF